MWWELLIPEVDIVFFVANWSGGTAKENFLRKKRPSGGVFEVSYYAAFDVDTT